MRAETFRSGEPRMRLVEPNEGADRNRTGGAFRSAQRDLVLASLAAQRHADVYPLRPPKPGPIIPPAVDRSSWTRPAA